MHSVGRDLLGRVEFEWQHHSEHLSEAGRGGSDHGLGSCLISRFCRTVDRIAFPASIDGASGDRGGIDLLYSHSGEAGGESVPHRHAARKASVGNDSGRSAAVHNTYRLHVVSGVFS